MAYYLDPFHYLLGSLLIFTGWEKPVNCRPNEFAVFDPAPNQTCCEYLAAYQQGMGLGSNLVNPDALADCQVCRYMSGADYIRTLNLDEDYYGWRNVGILIAFIFDIYSLVFVTMKLRTSPTKEAEP